jgi:excisionase family DNA binding protein
MKSFPAQIFFESEKMPRIARKANQDLREYPTYTIAEAAHYLAMPRRTLYRWASDHPLWTLASGTADLHLLSFQDLAQTYFIEFIRRHAGISLRKAKEILRIAKAETGSPYPLLDKNVKVLFKHIIIDRPARGRKPRNVVDLTQYPQYVLPDVVDLFAQRISRNQKGQLRELFPWRYYKPKENEERPVSLNPEILSGRLVITGTRIPVQVLWERHETGESLPDLALDYRLPEATLRNALRHIVIPKKAA